MFPVYDAVMSVQYSLVVACWERANLLALLYVMFSCVFVNFRCGVMGQVWYLIVYISDLCLYLIYHLFIKERHVGNIFCLLFLLLAIIVTKKLNLPLFQTPLLCT